MKNSRQIKRLIGCLFAASALGAPAAPLAIDEIYRHALEKTENVALSRAREEQSDARAWQATGRLLPEISVIAGYTRQHNPSSSGSLTAFTREEQSNARIALVQPLFRGLGEFGERNARNALARALEAETARARLTLYRDVSTAYYNTLSARKDLENLKAVFDLTERRVKELRERVQIGRSRKGELLAAQAQVASVAAQLEGARAALGTAEESFQFATNLPADTLLADAKEDPPSALPALDNLLRTAEGRPDIRAQREQLESADSQITVARAGHFPTLDLTANYYLKRTGVLENSKWDVGFALTIPLFQGGVVMASVREAYERRKEQELQLASVRRGAEREIRSLFRELTHTVAQHKALKTALSLAEDNYETQNRDYRFGLATSLDVLQALNTFQETKRQLNKTRYSALAGFAALQAATGTLP